MKRYRGYNEYRNSRFIPGIWSICIFFIILSSCTDTGSTEQKTDTSLKIISYSGATTDSSAQNLIEKEELLPDDNYIAQCRAAILENDFSSKASNSMPSFWKKLESISLASATDTSVLFIKKISTGETVTIYLTRRKFEAEKHKIRKEGNIIAEIDSIPYWGKNGTLPQFTVGKFRVSFGKKIHEIPPEAYCDLFQPNLRCSNQACFIRAFYDAEKKILHIYMSGSDGSGSYLVLWFFSVQKYLGRSVEHLC
jgi:hypothetical protein